MNVHVVPSAELPARTLDEIFALCDRAYEEDLRPAFRTLPDPVHVFAVEGGAVVSHALWVTRWLAPGARPPLRTAYVEAVATDPSWQGRGLATAVMRTLVTQISTFELAALSPSDRGWPLYTRLGWQPWTGPLFVREDSGLVETPDEAILIHRLPRTPPLDPGEPLSAEWRPGEVW
jgi:aminoglycoside 2'-N-acetyltransferase I